MPEKTACRAEPTWWWASNTAHARRFPHCPIGRHPSEGAYVFHLDIRADPASEPTRRAVWSVLQAICRSKGCLWKPRRRQWEDRWSRWGWISFFRGLRRALRTLCLPFRHLLWAWPSASGGWHGDIRQATWLCLCQDAYSDSAVYWNTGSGHRRGVNGGEGRRQVPLCLLWFPHTVPGVPGRAFLAVRSGSSARSSRVAAMWPSAVQGQPRALPKHCRSGQERHWHAFGWWDVQAPWIYQFGGS